jgi:hypothetical protein
LSTSAVTFGTFIHFVTIFRDFFDV